MSAELAGTLDAPTSPRRTCPRLVVPALADFCIVTAGRARRPPARRRRRGTPTRRSRALLERYAAVRMEAMPAVSPVARALVSGEPVPRAGRRPCSSCCRPARRRELLGRPAARDASSSCPCAAAAAPSGCSRCTSAPGSAVDDEDLATAQDVADRAGLALDNARLYSAQQQLAEGLQRSLLTEPPQPDHGEIAVRYLPAAEAARVGGDWYDAFLQPGGATMLVIGDVVGHDTEAAAAMGQLRGLLRGHRDLQRRRARPRCCAAWTPR